MHIKNKVWGFLVITDDNYCSLIHPKGSKEKWRGHFQMVMQELYNLTTSK